MYSFDEVLNYDPDLAKAMDDELGRQRSHIELIASENLVSKAVMAAMGSPLTNKYAEGYPGKRYYGGCEYVDVVETLAIERAKKLFGCEYANVQPHSGAQANLAVFFALVNPGDTVMGMSLDCGGHLSHGSPVNISGKYFNIVPYGVTAEGFIDYDEVLRIAACLEEHFPHSVANAIVNQAKKEGLIHEEEHAKVEYIIAHGIATSLYGKRAIIGSDHFVFEDEGIERTKDIDDVIRSCENEGAGSLIYLAIDNQVAGIISIYDPLKVEAKQAIHNLKTLGMTKVVMLTGDCDSAAKAVAHELDLDDYRASVLPEDKAAYIQMLKDQGHTVIMVGDGINDTPALSTADVSISMQDSSDLARELADITLVSSNLNELVILRRLAMNLFERIHANYRFIVAFNSSLIGLGALGLMSPNTTSLLHNGSTFAIAASCTRNYL